MKQKYFLIIGVLVAAILVIAAAVLVLSPAPFDLKYRFVPGDNLSYQITTVDLSQNLSDTKDITMRVIGADAGHFTLEMALPSESRNRTHTEPPARFSYNERGILGSLPLQKEMLTSSAFMPNMLLYPEKPVRTGDTWQYSPSFNGTMNASSLPVEYHFTASNSYAFKENGTIMTPTGTIPGARIAHTGTYDLTFSTSYENKMLSTTIKGKFSGDNWVSLEKGYLVTSEYDLETTTILDTSSAMNDPKGLALMGQTSKNRISTVMVRNTV